MFHRVLKDFEQLQEKPGHNMTTNTIQVLNWLIKRSSLWRNTCSKDCLKSLNNQQQKPRTIILCHTSVTSIAVMKFPHYYGK